MNVTVRMFDLIRVASAAPELRVSDVDYNVAQIGAAMEESANRVLPLS